MLYGKSLYREAHRHVLSGLSVEAGNARQRRARLLCEIEFLAAKTQPPFDNDTVQGPMSEINRLGELESTAAADAGGASKWHLSPSGQHRRGLRRYIGPKRTLALLTLTALVAGTWFLRRQGVLDPVLLQSFVNSYPVSSPIVMILIYSLGVVSGLPTLPLNLAAGVFWGPLLGGLISTVGTTLGAVMVFAAARSVFGRPLAARFDNKFISQVQKEFDDKGWRFIAFVRLNPVFPTGPLNYILGLTGINTFTYLWATFVFLLPPSIAVAFIGNRLGQFVVQGQTANFVTLMLTISAGVTVLAALAYGAHLVRHLQSK